MHTRRRREKERNANAKSQTRPHTYIHQSTKYNIFGMQPIQFGLLLLLLILIFTFRILNCLYESIIR